MGNGQLLDIQSHLFGQFHGIAELNIGQNGAEFFATITGHRVRGSPGRVFQRLGNLFQADVTCRMAVAVIQCLEKVHIDHDDRQRQFVAHTAAPFLIQHFVETAPVGHFGQTVDRHQLFQHVGFDFQQQLVADARHHNRQAEWLGDVIDRAPFQSSGLVLVGAAGRNENDGNVLGAVQAFELVADFVAIHARHGDIQQNQIGGIVAGGHLDGVCTAGCCLDPVPGRQCLGQHFDVQRFVIDYQNGLFVLDDHDVLQQNDSNQFSTNKSRVKPVKAFDASLKKTRDTRRITMISRQKRLLLTMALLLSTLGIALFFLHSGMARVYERQLQTQLLSARSQVRQDLGEWLADKQRILARWSALPDLPLQIGQLPVRGEYRLDAQDNPLLRAIALTDRLSPLLDDAEHLEFAVLDLHGNKLVTSVPAELGQRDPLALRPEWLQRLRRGEPVISFVRESVVAVDSGLASPAGVAHLYQPVLLQHEVVALLKLVVNVDPQITRSVRRERLWEHSHVYAFDARGNLISHYSSHPGAIPETRAAEPVLASLKAMQDQDEKSGTGQVDIDGFAGLDALTVVGAWAWYQQLGLGVAVEVDYAEAFAWLRVFKGIALLLVGLMAVILMLLLTMKMRRNNRIDDEMRLMENLTEGTSSLVFLVRTDGRVSRANKAVLALFGRNDVVGKSYSDLLPLELAVQWQQHDTQALQQDRSIEFIEPVVVNGQRRWLQLSRFPLRNQKKRVMGIACVGIDITERRRTEEALEHYKQNLDAIVLEKTQAVECERKRYVDIVQHALDPVITINAQGVIETFNPAAERIFGYSAMDAIGRNISLLMPDDVAVQHDEFLRKYADHPGQSVVVGRWRQVLARSRDKRLFPIEISVAKLGGGAQATFVGIVRDLSDRQEQDEILKVLFEHSTDAHVLFVDGKVLDCNLATLKLLRLPAKMEIVGKSMDAFSTFRQPDGDVSSEKYPALERYARDKGGEHFDWMLKCHDDSTLVVEVNLTPVVLGERSAMLAVWHDISERMDTQNLIKRNEQRIRDILDSTFQLMGLLAPDGTLLEGNKAAFRLIGAQPDDVLGRKIWDTPWWNHSRDQQLQLRERIIEVRNGQVVRFDAEHRNPGGKMVHVDFTMTPILVEGEVELIVVEGHDITAILDAREAERQAREEAESASRAKSEFLARMSHEIRTPMNAIIGMTRLCLNTTLTERQRQYLSSVDSAANSLLGIINDILDFSKIEAGKLELELIPFSLRDVFANVGAVVGLKAQEKGLEFVISDLDVPQQLMGDPMRLQQVLINLCSNGVKFTEQGHVALEVTSSAISPQQVRLRFVVQDTGIGLTPEQQGRLFESFSQADASVSRKYGGTGLGLTICRQLVNAMGGEISIHSEPGQGSLFSFELPFSIVDGRSVVKMQRRRAGTGSEQVLVVDDNPVCWKIAEKILRNNGYRVLVAESGQQALEWARDRRRRIDLVLMDWDLPDMNGIDASRSIRDAMGDRCPPIVLLTAYGQDDVLKETDFKPDGFLSKPINSGSLMDTVEQSLRKVRARDQMQASPAGAAQFPQEPPPRILLVEDNEINRFLVLENLQGLGLPVDFAENGAEALDKIQMQPYDLVLMDLQMPVMDGLECCRQLRTRYSLQQLPVIAMTANAFARERQRCQEVGMNAFITKPFETADLYQAIADHLGEAFPGWKRRLLGADGPTTPVLPSALPGIDMSAALARVNGNQVVYARLVEAFVDQFGQAVDGLRLLAERGDVGECRALAHRLKGVAGNLGFRRVYEQAQIVELLESLSLTDLEPHLAVLDEAMKEVVSSAEQLFALITTQRHDAAVMPLLSGERTAWLENLRERLQGSEVLDDDQIRQLRAALVTELLPEELDGLCHRIENFDYSGAVSCLDRVLAALPAQPAA